MGKEIEKKQFGLIGKNISYSFSKKYFEAKFKKENIKNAHYDNFDISKIEDITTIWQHKNTKGLNVTIPYKEVVIPYLDKISKKAAAIGAVNCIAIRNDKTAKGYNTDWYGFKKAIQPLLQKHHQKALILGTGGASKAIAYALKELHISYQFVSRTATQNEMAYTELTSQIMSEYSIIINTTPLGTHPATEEKPPIPYQFISAQHLVFDLVYNPEKTTFLALAELQGATIKNGLDMLVFQAEKAWEIWNKN